MRWASPYAVAAGIGIAGVFVVRAAIGVHAGWAEAGAVAAEAAGRFTEASSLRDRAAVGENLSGSLWRSGRSLTRLWRQLPAADRLAGPGDEVLRATALRYLEGRAVAPGSAWYTASLADVYKLRERTARQLRVVDVETLSRGSWALVGDDGRIAIGLARAAIDSEPTNFENRDQLMFLLEENGLHDAALIAIADSARVLPDFGAHPDFVFEELAPDLIEMFWRTSRAVPSGEVPLLLHGRKLVSSGILGRRLGHLAESEEDLRAALNVPGTMALNAEAFFYLGLVLADLGRYDDAETMLAQAIRLPAFGPGVATTRARIAMTRERWPEALAQLREARRLLPRELSILLEISRVAQKTKSWDQAEEALRWAILVHPESPEPRRRMVEMFLDQGEKASARRALDEYVVAFGKSDDAARMEQALAGPLDPARR